MMFVETPHGWEWSNSKLHIFFGGLNSSKDVLRTVYPQFTFNGVHQIHSSIVIEDQGSDTTAIQADGLFTDIRDRALCVVSADCVPILIHDKDRNRVFGLHAGWRGVASRILPAALTHISGYSSLEAWIGPHIQFPSFEVKADALDELKNSCQLSVNEFSEPLSSDSWLVDLNKVLLSQFSEFGIVESQIHFLNLDTKPNLKLHSYRRDAKNAGRQNSFIVLKS